jgi:NitT/TauT family transport system ATP-binding protein
VAHIVAQRLGTTSELVVRTLTGNLKTSPDGSIRKSDRYIVVGPSGANRPDPLQAAWAYAQVVRWGQAPLSEELQATAESVFRPDLYDAALGDTRTPGRGIEREGIGAFVGPQFDASDIAGYLASWRAKRVQRSHLSVVR